jgi:hypothetical protein
MTTTTTPTTKIVIVAGQEFSVPADTDNEAIRQQLVANFPDVASAKIKEGTKQIGDVTYPTIEFVKQAGTKGMDAGELAALLAHVPPTSAPRTAAGGLDRTQLALLRRLAAGNLTFDAALEAYEGLHDAVHVCMNTSDLLPADHEGGRVCAQIGNLAAVAMGRVPSGF